MYLLLGLSTRGEGADNPTDVCGAIGAVTAAAAAGLASGALYVVLTGALAAALLLEVAGRSPQPLQALALTLGRLRPLAAGTALAVAVVVPLLGLPLAALGVVEGCYGGGGAQEAVAAVRRAAEEAGRSGPARAMAWGSLLLACVYVVHAGVKWVLMPQAALFEGGSATEVLWRSRNLVRGRWLGVALVLAGLLLSQAILSTLIAAPFLFVSYGLSAEQGEPVRAAVRALAQVALLPLGAIGSTLIYLHLRQARESFGPPDLAQRARQFVAG